MSAYVDLEDFIRDRAAWLRVTTATNEHGNVDVVLRIDGSYAPPSHFTAVFGDAELEAAASGADEMVDYFREQLEPLLVALGIGGRLTDWRAELDT